jgi:hypothetical protein
MDSGLLDEFWLICYNACRIANIIPMVFFDFALKNSELFQAKGSPTNKCVFYHARRARGHIS